MSKLVRGATVEKKCDNCKKVFYPRLADVKRGWGKFCSKRCKAIKQEKNTGQYSRLLSETSFGEDDF